MYKTNKSHKQVIQPNMQVMQPLLTMPQSVIISLNFNNGMKKYKQA